MAEPSELQLLKQRAKLMGLSFSANASLPKMKTLVNGALNSEEIPEEEQMDVTDIMEIDKDILETPIKRLSAMQIRQRNAQLKRNAQRLVRVIVSCNNPMKREWFGQIMSVQSRIIGVHRKYVPFNNELGWHVPYCLYERLRSGKCSLFSNKTLKNGHKVRQIRQAAEFNVTVLPNLNQEELDALAAQQAVNRSID